MRVPYPFAVFAKGWAGLALSISELKTNFPAPSRSFTTLRRVHFQSDLPPSSLLWQQSPTFHHLQLSRSAAVAGERGPPRLVSQTTGGSSSAVSLRGCWICRGARALSFANQRAGSGYPLDRDAGAEAALWASSSGRVETVGFSALGNNGVATAVLRFQCMDSGETDREAAVHPSQPGETRTRAGTRAVGME